MPESQGVVLTNKMNKVEGKHVHNYSTFNDTLSYPLAFTARFGEYAPSFVMDGVERDNISVNSKDLIDSLSLKAPFKGSVRKIKESFMVPLMSILPMNWDRIYVQPSNGDDVPNDANCVLVDFPQRFSTFWKAMFSAVSSNFPDSSQTVQNSTFYDWMTALLRMLVTGEYIYSDGSLPNLSGYKISGSFLMPFNGLEHGSYDEFFDYCVRYAFQDIKSFQLAWKEGDQTRYRWFKGLHSDSSDAHNASSLRAALELMRENPIAYINSINYGGNNDATTASSNMYYYLISDGTLNMPLNITPYFYLPEVTTYATDLKDMNPSTFNLSRILAYQIVCAHYYTNSSIDFVYTAELYRQYVRSLVLASNNNNSSSSSRFIQNGIEIHYDFLSGRVLVSGIYRNLNDTSDFSFSYAQLCLRSSTDTNFYHLFRLSVLAAIFGFRKSLRYGDYFVGSRPRPLAPINTDVAVNNNMVSVIDITKGIMSQKFGNAVMRSRQKIEEYVKSLFGNSPAPDYHNPFYLSREVESIFGDEVQNTAQSQTENPNSRTANFASNAGRFTFTFHNDDMHPCVYLQIISFDIERFYTRSIERQFMQLNRYDMFNPDFQYIGDQPVYGMELGYPNNDNNPYIPATFGYQTRDEEYKQRYAQASGGFVHNLPGWILTDRDQSIAGQTFPHISPDFIRSYCTEFDQFFLSLTGYSLGSYFHFNIITRNNVDAKRAMAVDPQILD